ncbi:MAG: hypothetical protein J6W41_00500 [Alphaproteobacteria bacterium]|nr:hypothetical protein [Alphaproteobacteria bacterium]
MFSADWFWGLEKTLRERGLDSDDQSFDEIRENLARPKRFAPDAFADACSYVILAGGFSQKTAKRIHFDICKMLRAGAGVDALLGKFNNKNKINAIYKIWQNRDKYCAEYYAQKTLDDKLKFLQNLPHIGKITSHHLARNLGENVVKYDVWIQRLGIAFAMQSSKYRVQSAVVDNQKLNPQIKKYCDAMFDCLVRETNLPRGYIDVVLWKAAQNKLIIMDDCL